MTLVQRRQALKDIVELKATDRPSLLPLVERFAATLGSKPVTDADLNLVGWPATRATRRLEVLIMVRQIQGGKDFKTSPTPALSPRLRPSLAPPAASASKEENFQDPNLPLFLGKEVIASAKEFVGKSNKYSKKTGDKKLRSEAANAFLDLGIALFDAVYGERDEEEASAADEGETGPERPRPLIRAALIHTKVPKGQQEVFGKIDSKQLEMLLNAINVETKMYNPIEDSFAQLETDAEAFCESTCRKFAGKLLKNVPQECKACVNWWSRKEQLADEQKKLEAVQKSGDSKKIKSLEKKVGDAEEALGNATRELYETKVIPIREKFKHDMAKRLRKLFLGSEAELIAEEAAEEQEEKAEIKLAEEIFKKETSAERKLREQAEGTGQSAYMRAQFMKAGTQKHKDWTAGQVMAAVDRVMRARQAQVDDEPGADKEFKEAEAILMGKGKYAKAAAPAAAAKPKVKPKAAAEEEDEEEDEDYAPDDGGDTDDDEGDEDEEGEDAKDTKSGGLGPRQPQPQRSSQPQPQPPRSSQPRPLRLAQPQRVSQPREREKPLSDRNFRRRENIPKSYSGQGAFTPTPTHPFENSIRFGGGHGTPVGRGGFYLPQPFRLGRALPPPLAFRTTRTGGGCACDPLYAPKEDD